MHYCGGRGLRKYMFATLSELMNNVFGWPFVFTGGLLSEAEEAPQDEPILVNIRGHDWPGFNWSTLPQIMLQELHWIFSPSENKQGSGN